MTRPRYVVACPKCGVGAGEHCRSLTTNRITDTHLARIDQQAKARDAGFGSGGTRA